MGLHVRMDTNEPALRERLARRLVLACLLVLTISNEAPAQSTGKTVRHHRVEEQDPAAAGLAEAEAEIDKHDYASAESLLKKFLETYPDSYSAWYDLGFVYHALDKKEDSIAAYRKSVAAKPEVFESNLNLGLALANAGEPEAEQFLREATKLKPISNPAQGQKRVWMALGHLLETSKPDEAASAFQQASGFDPKDPEPHLAAGSLLEKQHPANAEKEYQQALVIAPESSDALPALPNLYMRQRRFPEAESVLRKLLVLGPNDAGAHLQLGRMLAIAGKNEEAATELEAGLKLDPADSKAQRDLADLYSESGKYDQAQKLYGPLIASYPTDASLHHGLGQVLLKQKKFAEAEQELPRAVQLQRDLGVAYGDLAFAPNENKDNPLVIKAPDLPQKYLPEIPISYFLR